VAKTAIPALATHKKGRAEDRPGLGIVVSHSSLERLLFKLG
jgi:hypothetical protein